MKTVESIKDMLNQQAQFVEKFRNIAIGVAKKQRNKNASVTVQPNQNNYIHNEVSTASSILKP